jgi:hypothetical protein
LRAAWTAHRYNGLSQPNNETAVEQVKKDNDSVPTYNQKDFYDYLTTEFASSAGFHVILEVTEFAPPRHIRITAVFNDSAE